MHIYVVVKALLKFMAYERDIQHITYNTKTKFNLKSKIMGKKLMMLLLGAFTCLLVNAQVKTVTGRVTSADNGESLVGVSVSVPGTTVGVNTDGDGRFTLSKLPASAKQLRFSFIGMETQVLPVKSVMNVALKSNDKVLGGVVVTALGIKRSEKSLGYSATSVKTDEITETRNANVMDGLQGKIAGVSISNNSAPGSTNSVIIRGFQSLAGSNQPLYVIDGVPMSNEAIQSSDELNHNYDFGSGANAINPDDVAEMTVLKGAAATALYGSRAANGVIMITTKKGRKRDKGLGVTYNGGIQFSNVARLVEMQNRFGQGASGEHVQIENGSWGPRFDGLERVYGYVYDNSQRVKSYSPIKNNIRDFFDTGVMFNNSVSFDGATDKSDFFVSLSNINNNGVFPTRADAYNKYTFSTNGSYRVNNKLTFSSTVNYSYQKNNFISTGQRLNPIYALYNVPRDVSITAQKDLSDPFNTPGYYYTPYNATNPYYILKNYLDESEVDKLWGKFQADYSIFDFLKFTYRVGMDYTIHKTRSGIPNMSALWAGTPNWDNNGEISGQKGWVYTMDRRERLIDQDFLLNFSKPINDDFNLDAIVGLNTHERKLSIASQEVNSLDVPTWFNTGNSGSTPAIVDHSYHSRLVGLYGQVEGSWKDMVYLTVTGRNDWSSTLPKANRSYFYPGFTGSFVFTELLPRELKDIISFGKFRAAWGKTGNDASWYSTQTVYAQAGATTGFGSLNFPLNGVNAFTLSNIMGNDKLKPEMTTEWELGLNMAFLHNRLSFDFAYYNRSTNNQTLAMNLDPGSGYTRRYVNLGEITNKGVELLIQGTPIKTRDWQWDLNMNWTLNRSKVVSLPKDLGSEVAIFGFSGGTGLYAVKGMPLGMYKAQKLEHDPEGHVVVSAKNGLPVKSDKYDYCGDMNHKYTLGWGTTLRWKDFSITANMEARVGGKVYTRTKGVVYFTGIAKQTVYNDRKPFIVPNSVNKVTAADGSVSYVENTTALSYNYIQSYWADQYDCDASDLVSRSFVKLRDVALTWNLPKRWIDRTFLTGASVSLFGRNLLMWTPSDNTFFDPESSSFSGDLAAMFGEYGTNPSTRTYGFNIKISF